MEDIKPSNEQSNARDNSSTSENSRQDKPSDIQQSVGTTGTSRRTLSNRVVQFFVTRREHWKNVAFHDRVNIYLSLVIAVSTTIYTFFAGWTLSEIRSGSKDTHELAVAGRDQWRELNATRQYAHENLTLHNRPWLGFVDNAVSVKEVSSMREWEVSYRVRNYGDSPARRVTSASFVKWGDIEKWSGFLCEDMEQNMHDGTKPATVIFPKTELRFSETVRSAIPFGDKQKHWLIVRIGYHDVWGPPNKFCAVLFYSLDDSIVIGSEVF
jgi:hypothetical protein